MIAGAQEAENRVNGRHAGGEDVRRRRALEFREAAFQGLSIGVIRSGVVISLVLAERILKVGRSLIDRRNN